MNDTQLPLELVSNFISIVILVLLLLKYYQYKKKMAVLKELDDLKEKKKLTSEDKNFIKSNFSDYKMLMARDEQRLKLFYPFIILIVGVVVAFLPLNEALIHLNVVVVAYIFLYVSKIHSKNFATLLHRLNKDLV